MVRFKKPKPLLIGPDLNGRSLVIAGDRVCWFGVGDPPRTPGALRLDACGTVINGAVLLRCDGERAFEAALAAVATAVVLVGGPDAVEAWSSRMRARGVRVFAAIHVADACDAERARALHSANRDPLVRVGLAPSRWEGAASLAADLGVPLDWDDQPSSGVLERHFGRRADLSPGAMGDAVVSDGAAVRHVVVGGRLVMRDGEALSL